MNHLLGWMPVLGNRATGALKWLCEPLIKVLRYGDTLAGLGSIRERDELEEANIETTLLAITASFRRRLRRRSGLIIL